METPPITQDRHKTADIADRDASRDEHSGPAVRRDLLALPTVPHRRADLGEFTAEEKKERRKVQARERKRKERERKRTAQAAERAAIAEEIISLAFDDESIRNTNEAAGIRLQRAMDPPVDEEDLDRNLINSRDAVDVNDAPTIYSRARLEANATSLVEEPDLINPDEDMEPVAGPSNLLNSLTLYEVPYKPPTPQRPRTPKPLPALYTMGPIEELEENSGLLNPVDTEAEDTESSRGADTGLIIHLGDTSDEEEFVPPHQEDDIIVGDTASLAPEAAQIAATGEEPNPLKETAAKMFSQFSEGFHGCTLEEHESAMDTYTENQWRCVRLQNAAPPLKNVSGTHTYSVLNSPTMLERSTVSKYGKPSAAQWQANYCGISEENPATTRRPQEVNLRREPYNECSAEARFDVDSLLGFAKTIGFAREGVNWQPVPLFRQNIKTDVHLQTGFNGGNNAQGETVTAPSMIRDIPHLYFGRVLGAEEISIHILFPNLPRRNDSKRFKHLTEKQLTTWYDKLWYPALKANVHGNLIQHIPCTYEDAVHQSLAHQTENRVATGQGYNTQRATVHCFAQSVLENAWETMVDAIDSTTGYKHYANPIVFFSAKNLKLRWKEPQYLDMVKAFWGYMESKIDFQHVAKEEFYVDVGREVCPQKQASPSVFLWRDCCLRAYMKWIYDDVPPAAGGNGQRYYAQNMLRDAAGLTSVPPKRHKLRRGGLVYSQCYASMKELFDAQKLYPFDVDGLEEMALDPAVRETLSSIGRGRARDIQVITDAYLAMKKRVSTALSNAKANFMSYGVREEHRMAWPLIEEIATMFGATASSESVPLEAQPHPSRGSMHDGVLSSRYPAVWSIRARHMLDYLGRNADKFATGFEFLYASRDMGAVPWERTKMMMMFLRCLRFTFNCLSLQRETALWAGVRQVSHPRHERKNSKWIGLGFGNTLPRYGYCWIEPRIDWGRLQFEPHFTAHVLFGNQALANRYRNNYHHVNISSKLMENLDQALAWLQEYIDNRIIRRRMIEWMAHIILKQFRMDVFNTIKKDLDETQEEEVLRGDHPLCHLYLTQVCRCSIVYMSGKRMGDMKDLAFYLTQLFMTKSDEKTKKHSAAKKREEFKWDKKPFRVLISRAKIGLRLIDKEKPGHRVRKQLNPNLMTITLHHHWVFPGYSKQSLCPKVPGGARRWYAVRRSRSDEPFEWSGPMTMPGTPAKIPAWTTNRYEDWASWFKGQGINLEQGLEDAIALAIDEERDEESADSSPDESPQPRSKRGRPRRKAARGGSSQSVPRGRRRALPSTTPEDTDEGGFEDEDGSVDEGRAVDEGGSADEEGSLYEEPRRKRRAVRGSG